MARLHLSVMPVDGFINALGTSLLHEMSIFTGPVVSLITMPANRMARVLRLITNYLVDLLPEYRMMVTSKGLQVSKIVKCDTLCRLLVKKKANYVIK